MIKLGIMKKFIKTTIALLLSLHLLAQNREKVAGIFITGKEFREGKLSLVINCNSKKDKISLHDLLNEKYITIRKNDSTYNFMKDSIYGYETCGNDIYRFLGKMELLLLDDRDEIVMYKWNLPKRSAGGRTNITPFYFSMGKEGPLQKLTIKNLKDKFVDNKKFIFLIDQSFKYNSDLGEFDKTNKRYKVNLLLEQSNH
jgi:hypothetical protein